MHAAGCTRSSKRQRAPRAEVDSAAVALNPAALTIGFARRLTAYKRATLLLTDLDRLARILGDPRHPAQVIFAGKAHPRDEEGKEIIRRIVTLGRDKRFRGRLLFLEDYDMAGGALPRPGLRRVAEHAAPAVRGQRHEGHEGRRQRRAESEHPRWLVGGGNTHRMVREYAERFYASGAAQVGRLLADDAARALAAWEARVRQAWSAVTIAKNTAQPPSEVAVGDAVHVATRLRPGTLTPNDVAVQLVLGQLDGAGDIVAVEPLEMKLAGSAGDSSYVFEAAAVPCTTSGAHRFTVRVLPRQPDMPDLLIPGLLTWAGPTLPGA